jgi:hypothetical protein
MGICSIQTPCISYGGDINHCDKKLPCHIVRNPDGDGSAGLEVDGVYDAAKAADWKKPDGKTCFFAVSGSEPNVEKPIQPMRKTACTEADRMIE